MTLAQVGLVDTTGRISTDLMQSVAAALNVQVTRDLPQFWPVQASVQYLADSDKVPSGVWPVKLVASLPPGEGGFHLDKNNQPYSKVIASPDDDSWSIDASHETLEMLVDPAGNRMQSALAIEISGGTIKNGSGQFNYLVEACDPCEGNTYGYQIQGVLVSDFITPHFYDSLSTPGTRYSFTGAITAPRQVLPGGYISFVNEEADEWQQILYLNSAPQLNNLGPADGTKRSLREWVDNEMESGHRDKLAKIIRSIEEPRRKALQERRAKLDSIARSRAKEA
jgi:hypothetical protein